ncbi:MAG: zinc ribbon domain-containing protein [Candidatus Korarchaeum sp.]
MFRRGKNARKHNRKVAKSDWKIIQFFMSYKARVVILNPKDTSRRCSRCGRTDNKKKFSAPKVLNPTSSGCGMVNAPKGAFVCECGLRMDRQLNAAVNLYLQMEGLSPSPKLFEELMAWSGFTLTGEEASGLEAGESQGLSVDILIHT